MAAGKKVTLCAGEIPREIKQGAVGSEKRVVLVRKHCRGSGGMLPWENFEI